RRADSARSSAASEEVALRAGDFAGRVLSGFGSGAVLDVEVESCPPQHVGLGVGTQLGLAVGTAVAALLGRSPDTEGIARILGRGRRSGIGLHGFHRGGFLVDGGKGPTGDLAPVVFRHDFPADWRILLVTPNLGPGLSGPPETAAFARLGSEGVRSE